MKYQRNAGEPPENRRKTAGELPRGEQEQKIYRYVLENAYITRAQVMTLLDLKQRRAKHSQCGQYDIHEYFFHEKRKNVIN